MVWLPDVEKVEDMFTTLLVSTEYTKWQTDRRTDRDRATA